MEQSKIRGLVSLRMRDCLKVKDTTLHALSYLDNTVEDHVYLKAADGAVKGVHSPSEKPADASVFTISLVTEYITPSPTKRQAITWRRLKWTHQQKACWNNRNRTLKTHIGCGRLPALMMLVLRLKTPMRY